MQADKISFFLFFFGARTDLKPTQTWESYCKEIGVPERTIYNWFYRFNLLPNGKRLKTPEMPEGKYQIILADPPWQFRNIGEDSNLGTNVPRLYR